MLNRKPSTRFLKDIKLAKKRGLNIRKLEEIITLLCENKALPMQCRPHILSGKWSNFWECHIEPDWLLIYQTTEDDLELVRTGTHSDLF
jgi:mRNA interferase YafQ